MKKNTARLDLASVRHFEDGKGFCDALLKVLSGQSDLLPLEACCHRGGWPQEIIVTRIEMKAHGDQKIELTVCVAFTETGAACCSGDVFEYRHFVELPLTIDKADWSGSFPI